MKDAALFVLLFFGAAYFRHPIQYDNSLSRLFLVSAVVDDGTLAIDAHAADTVDLSQAGGHSYSNKAIGASLAAVPFYYALRHWTPVGGDAPLSPRARYLLILLVSALPFALSGVLVRRVARILGANDAAALEASLAYGLGTIAWLHSSLFSGHQLAAAMGLLALDRILSKRNLALAGAAAGYAVLSDFTAVIIAAGLAAFFLTGKLSPRQKLSFFLGLVCVLSLLPAYNLACFGNPFSVSYSHLSHPEFAAGASHGLLGFGLPQLSPLLQLLFSPARGLFFIMPVLLLAPTGLWAIRRRREAPFLAGIIVVYVVALSGFYGWHGGWSFGPRYLVPALPFLAVPIAFSPDRRWFRPLLLLSFLQVGVAQIGVPDVTEWIRNPLRETIIPLLGYGDAAVGWGQNLGLSFAASVLLFLVITATGVAWLHRTPFKPSLRPRDLPYPLAMTAIVLALCLVHTPAEIRHHQFNARLLRDAAREFHSPAFARAAAVEDAR